MTSPGDDPQDRRARNKATHWVLGALAVGALVLLLLFLLLGNVLEDTTAAGAAAAPGAAAVTGAA